MFVGITSGATTVWNPLSGTSSCTGCCSGGFSCFGWSTNTIAVSTLTLLSASPALSVAYTAPAITTVCTTSDTAPTPKTRLLLFLRLDSMRLSNTGCRPPVPVEVTAYEIPPIGLRPLVEPPLQNDDSRVRRRRHLRRVRRHGIRTRTARPGTRPGPSASRREGESNRQAHQHAYRPAARAPRPEQRAEHVSPRGRLEAGVRAFEHQRARLGPAERVDHDLDHHGSRNPAAPQPLRLCERPTGEHRRRLLHHSVAPRTIRLPVHPFLALRGADAALQDLVIHRRAGGVPGTAE